MDKNILIVEDEESIRNLLVKIVATLDLVPDTASNGQEGYDLFTKNKYDLIITDMKMPVMNGRDMIKKIRDDESGRNTPLIILSAYISIVEVKDLLEVGATYFLNKPIEMDDLIEYIQKCLDIPESE
ncbi:MAG: response regulator [Planctomycetota bacterium]|nr:MAG: response regulator [Planctomycetota bacterium]